MEAGEDTEVGDFGDSSQNLKIAYTCNESDFIHAGLLMLRKRSRFLVFLPWMMLLLLGWTCVQFIANPETFRKAFSGEQWPKTMGGLALPLLIACLPLITRYGLRKQYRSSKILQETRTLSFDDFGYETASPSATGRVAWSVYVRWFEDQHNFLLVQQGKVIFVPLPKREMTSEQVASLRELLSRHIQK